MNPNSPTSKSKGAPNFRPLLLFFLSLGSFLLAGSLLIHFLGMYFGLIATQFTAIFGVALIYRKVRAIDPEAPAWPTARRTNTSPATLALIIFTTVVLGLFSNFFGALIIELIPALKPLAEESKQAMDALLFNTTPFNQVLGAISISIVAPICEETMFRGTILPEQRANTRSQKSVIAAVILNGVLFSAMHLSLVSFAPLVIVGAFFAYLTIRTNSLLPAIFAHSTLNIVNGVILPRLVNANATLEQAEPTLIQLVAITIPFAIVLTALWLLLSRRLSHEIQPNDK